MKNIFTVLIGGKAGEGVKKAASVISHSMNSLGRNVFEMDDYPSLIKGGHNFSVVSSSVDSIYSHYGKADVIISLDERSFAEHSNDLAAGGVHIFDSKDGGKTGESLVPLKISSIADKYSKPELIRGVSAVVAYAFMAGFSKEDALQIVNDGYEKNSEENSAYASEIYDELRASGAVQFSIEQSGNRGKILSGNEAIALGLAAAGAEYYFAYPMTPSSSILHFLAQHRELGVRTVHPESEIAVVNMAIGAAFTGAKSALGSSGGGFALMQEGLSLAGMSETPLMCVLSSRSGPSTGVPTYTEQGDLMFALNQGHGEFPIVVASPGTVEQAYYLAAELLQLAWRFQAVSILLTEKHMSESSMSIDKLKDLIAEHSETGEKSEAAYGRYRLTVDGISPMKFPPSEELIKASSYEHDENGITTEKADIVSMMHEKRLKKQITIEEHLKNEDTVKRYGTGRHKIVAYGSTLMSVLEAVKCGEIDAEVIQPIYLKPFPKDKLGDLSDAIIVEQSASGSFSALIKEKCGVKIKRTITKYDGRPFSPEELSEKLKEAING